MNERDLGRKLRNAALALPPLLTIYGGGFADKVNAASNCQFVLGFKTLHDAAPEIVGDCLDNEAHNPSNGDGLQHTTKGLEVWRKNSNTMAFTTGGTTFLLDPGTGKIISRDAMSRFQFEPDYPALIVPIDPRFGSEKTERIRTALYSFPYDFIGGDYIDSDFRTAWVDHGLSSSLLNQLISYTGQHRPTDYLKVVDSITPYISEAVKGCPPDKSISCQYVRNTLSKSGSIVLYDSAFMSDQMLLLVNLKEALGINVLLFMLNILNISDPQILLTASEQYSLDASLNFAPKLIPNSVDIQQQYTIDVAPFTWGQNRRFTEVVQKTR